MGCARLRRGWTQDQMAEATGLATDSNRRLEHAAFNPSLDTLRKIADGLGLRLAFAVMPVLQHDRLSSS